MKKIVSLLLLVVVFWGGTNKACAQLEGKSLYIYDTNDNVELRFYCSDKECKNQHAGSWYRILGWNKAKVVYVYKDGSLQEDWIVAWNNYDKGVYIFCIAREVNWRELSGKRYWCYYEWLNVITPFSPEELGRKREEALRKNPWSYGQKAILR